MKLPWLRRPTDDEMLVGAVRAKVDMGTGPAVAQPIEWRPGVASWRWGIRYEGELRDWDGEFAAMMERDWCE